MSTKVRVAVTVAFAMFCMTATTLAAPSGGGAQAQAEARIQKGLDLRRKMRDADALVEFQEAMKIFPSPRAKAQVGLAQLAVGLFEAAETTLSEVLGSSGDDPWVSSHRDALADALGKVRDHLGTLNVSGEPRGASVEINGAPTCTLPCSIHVQAGDVIVKVQAPGFLPLTRTVSVEARQIASRVFTLVKAAKDPAAGTATSSGETPPHENKSVETVQTEKPSGESTPAPATSTSPWPWIAAGGSVAALTFGAIEGARWYSKAEEYNNKCSSDGSGGSACSSLLNEGHTARALTVGGLVVGVALGVTAVILFTRESSDDAGSAVACAPLLAPAAGGANGLACAARF